MFVYFIQAGHKGAIKIGHTENLDRRIENLQVGNPFKLRVLATIHCDSIEHARGLEEKLHRFFKKKHIRGEWFKESIRIADYNHKGVTDFK